MTGRFQSILFLFCQGLLAVAFIMIDNSENNARFSWVLNFRGRILLKREISVDVFSIDVIRRSVGYLQSVKELDLGATKANSFSGREEDLNLGPLNYKSSTLKSASREKEGCQLEDHLLKRGYSILLYRVQRSSGLIARG